MKQSKKAIGVLLVLTLVFGQFFSSTPELLAKSTKIALNKKKVTVTVGKTVKLKLLNAKKKVKWSSNKKSVATVSSKGIVKAKKPGNAKITAKCNKKKYTCKVYIKKKTKKPTDTTSTPKETQVPNVIATAEPTVKPAETPVPTVKPTPDVTNITMKQIKEWNEGNQDYEVVCHENDKVSFISGKVYPKQVKNQEDAYEAVAALRDLKQSKDINLCYIQTDKDSNGDIYYRFNQYVKGYIIPNCQVILGTDAEGNTISYSVSLLADTKNVDAHDLITAEEAVEKTKEQLGDEFISQALAEPYMEIICNDEQFTFSWAVIGKNSDFLKEDDQYPFVKYSIDAHTGKLLSSMPIASIGNPTSDDTVSNELRFKTIKTKPMEFTDAQGNKVTLPVAEYYDKDKDTLFYRIIDTKRKIVTYDYLEESEEEFHHNLYLFKNPEDVSPNFVSIVSNMLKIYDFYEKIGYKSTDGKGKNSIGIYLGLKENGVKVINAGYYGTVDNESFFAFSDYKELITSLDAAAHEYAHAIQGNLAPSMEYRYLSGAFMESFADIMGNLLEMSVLDEKQCDKETWAVGEENAASVDGALRFMGDPHKGDQPEFVGDLFWTSNLYSTYRGNDLSGVHTNSSVLSHICYTIFKNNADKFTYEDYFKLWFTTGYLAINASNFDDYEAYVRYSLCRHGESDDKKTVEKAFEKANTSNVNEKEWTYDLQKNCSYIRFDSSECKENEFLCADILWNDQNGRKHCIIASNQGEDLIAMVPNNREYAIKYRVVSKESVVLDCMIAKDQVSVGESEVKSVFRRNILYPNYVLGSAWAIRPSDKELQETPDVDIFFVNPTAVGGSEAEYNMEMYDLEERESFIEAINMEKGIYNLDDMKLEDADFCEGKITSHFFAPFYRQQTLSAYHLNDEKRKEYKDKAYEDVKGAFDYFLSKHKEGTPIILAGFSQGSEMIQQLLVEYREKEAFIKDYLASFAIGWSFSDEFLEENPSVKMAQKEDDTGVVVSFCSEAVEHNASSVIVPENVHTNGINPLNWKTDSTVADKSENLGACFVNGDGSVEKEIPNLCGAYLDPVRGTLKVTDIEAGDYPPVLDLFDPGNFHIYDYQFFYNNLRQNVMTRLLSWYGCR